MDGSRCIRPALIRSSKYPFTVDGDFNPTAAPISRIEVDNFYLVYSLYNLIISCAFAFLTSVFNIILSPLSKERLFCFYFITNVCSGQDIKEMPEIFYPGHVLFYDFVDK